jgi:hypothetical protein
MNSSGIGKDLLGDFIDFPTLLCRLIDFTIKKILRFDPTVLPNYTCAD